MKSDCAAGMQFPLCLNVGGVGKFWSLKLPQINLFAVESYGGGPFGSVSVRPNKAGGFIAFMRSALVLTINQSINIAQIAPFVIARVSVNMVDVVRRPAFSHVEPSQSVCKVSGFFYSDVLIPATPNARDFSGDCPASIGPTPIKTASFWVVVKKFAQTLRGKIGLSHDALLMLIGQRPACVGSTCGLRYFSGGM